MSRLSLAALACLLLSACGGNSTAGVRASTAPVARCLPPAGDYVVTYRQSPEDAHGCSGIVAAEAHYERTYPLTSTGGGCAAEYSWDEGSRTDRVVEHCPDGVEITHEHTWSCNGEHGAGTQRFTLGKCELVASESADALNPIVGPQ